MPKKKTHFLPFCTDLPIKKAGANFIGRTLDTINHWEKLNGDFAERVLKAKAEYARKRGKGRPDYLLPKLYSEFKPEKQELEVTIPTAITISHVHPGNNNQPDKNAG